MDNLKKKCENSQAPKPEKLEFTNAETENFKKAFDDPEFRKMFTEYMDEMQDPKNRQVEPNGPCIILKSSLQYSFSSLYHYYTCHLVRKQKSISHS